MKKDTKYEVYMGFRNYKGEIYDWTRVATFYSRNRAEEYAELCNEDEYDNCEYVVVNVSK